MQDLLFHYSGHENRTSEPMHFVPIGDSPAPGERLTGTVKTPPIKARLSISSIKLELVAEYWYLRRPENGPPRMEKTGHVLLKDTLYTRYDLDAGEVLEFPIDLTLPKDCPLSLKNSRVCLVAYLDIPWAIDRAWEMPVEIPGPKSLPVVISAVEQLGFSFQEITNDYKWLRSPRLRQNFVFKPEAKPWFGKLDSLTLRFRHEEAGLGVELEFDSRAHDVKTFFNEVFGNDKIRIAAEIENALMEGKEATLHKAVQDFVRDSFPFSS